MSKNCPLGFLQTNSTDVLNSLQELKLLKMFNFVSRCFPRAHRAGGLGGREQQLSEQRESVRDHQGPARPAVLPPREQLHGDEVRRAQRAGVHRDQPAAVQHGQLTQR